LLAGEKQVPIDKHGVGWWDSAYYNGDYKDATGRGLGLGSYLTTNPKDRSVWFGSHIQAVLFLYADDHVQPIQEFTNRIILDTIGNRAHGQVVPSY